MPRQGDKREYVNLRTRVPKEIGDYIHSLSSNGYPPYRVLRDIVTAHAAGTNGGVLNYTTYKMLQGVAMTTGYQDVNELLNDLIAAFLRAYRSHHDQLPEDEPTPSEEIREMFAELMEK